MKLNRMNDSADLSRIIEDDQLDNQTGVKPKFPTALDFNKSAI